MEKQQSTSSDTRLICLSLVVCAIVIAIVISPMRNKCATVPTNTVHRISIPGPPCVCKECPLVNVQTIPPVPTAPTPPIPPAPTPAQSKPMIEGLPTDAYLVFQKDPTPIIIGYVVSHPNYKMSFPTDYPHLQPMVGVAAKGEVVTELKYYDDQFSNLMSPFPKSAIFLDIGANVGMSGLPIATRGWRVIGFEPIYKNTLKLKQSIFLNNLKNFYVVHAAAGDHNGNTTLYVPGTYGDNASQDKGSAALTVGGSVAREETVRMYTIDQFFSDYSHQFNRDEVLCVKIDVQGYEPSVVRGMEQLLKANRDRGLVVVAEHHHKLLQSANKGDELSHLRFVTSLGYRVTNAGGGTIPEGNWASYHELDIYFRK